MVSAAYEVAHAIGCESPDTRGEIKWYSSRSWPQRGCGGALGHHGFGTKSASFDMITDYRIRYRLHPSRDRSRWTEWVPFLLVLGVSAFALLAFIFH
jgi:hypothetical protein